MDARAAEGQVLGFVCTSSGLPYYAGTAWHEACWGPQCPRGTCSTTTAQFQQCLSLPAMPFTQTHTQGCNEEPVGQEGELLRMANLGCNEEKR